MSLVKPAAGGHKADALPSRSQLASGGHHSRNAVDYLHPIREVARDERLAIGFTRSQITETLLNAKSTAGPCCDFTVVRVAG